MKKQNIEDIFSSMENFSSIPPPDLWGKIEEKLDKPKKKKRVLLWWSAAACLLLGLLLPSVLHFTSDSSIKTTNNGSVEKNNIVVEEKKNELNNTLISTEENNEQKNNGKKNSIAIEENSAAKEESNASHHNQKTTVVPVGSENKTKNNFTDPKSKTEKRALNQAVAEKTFSIGKQNTFNSVSKYQLPNTKKTTTDKILTEKSFSSGETKGFNSNSNNPLSNSIFEDQLTSKNNTNIAFNTSNSNNNQNTFSSNTKTQKNEIQKSEKEIAGNSKFNDVLSKQDSVQLAELQNLEKGIIKTDPKKDKEIKPISAAEKWAVEVFAGVASSENYKNDKTLGSTNDSKQSNTYGVKTKYKINKKWAVGSGFKINELGQSVANVSYINNKNSAFMSSSDYFNQNITTTTSQTQITNNSDYVFVSHSTTNALKSNNVESSNLKSGNLDQSLRYVEMPLEVSYSVFTKNKASISLNTGGFVGKLISNNVALNGNSIGENSNANDFVYGSTLSSTVQYRVYKKTNVFVEPAMNYYMNPLNNQSFNQFQLGLNFGLNVSF